MRTAHDRSTCTRHGITLAEMMIAMGVGSVVLAVATGVLYNLFRVVAQAREHQQQDAAMEQLADRFRSDVHAASGLKRPTADDRSQRPREWLLQLDVDKAVRYRAEAEGLIRQVLTGQKVTQQEWFALPAGTTASIDESKQGAWTIVTLRITPGAASPGQLASESLCVESVVAWDRRWENSEEDGEPR